MICCRARHRPGTQLNSESEPALRLSRRNSLFDSELDDASETGFSARRALRQLGRDAAPSHWHRDWINILAQRFAGENLNLNRDISKLEAGSLVTYLDFSVRGESIT